MAKKTMTAYTFAFVLEGRRLTFPITPGSLKMEVQGKNETVTLINGQVINLLQRPDLRTYDFQARFPTRKYPYSSDPSKNSEYIAFLEDLLYNKKPFRFVVVLYHYSPISIALMRKCKHGAM